MGGEGSGSSRQAALDERSRLRTGSLIIMASVALAFAMSVTSGILVPLVLAWFISYLVVPLVDAIQTRGRLPRAVAVVICVLLISAAAALLIALLSASVASVSDRAEFYEKRILSLATGAAEWLQGVGVQIDPTNVAGEINKLPVLDMMKGALGGVVGLLATSVLVILFTLFIVAGREPNTPQVGLWGEIERSVKRYMATKALTSLATGVAVWLILWGFGLDLAMPLGVLTFLLNFIPNIGSLIATVLPFGLALIQFESPTNAFLILGAILVVNQVIGNVIEPKLMGEELGLHPLTILTALGVWGMIWGLPGMLLSAPLTVVVRIVLERYEITRPTADFLAGRR